METGKNNNRVPTKEALHIADVTSSATNNKMTKRKSNVTIKTLKAWFEHNKRIAENKLLTEKDEKELLRITKAVKEKFINENF